MSPASLPSLSTHTVLPRSSSARFDNSHNLTLCTPVSLSSPISLLGHHWIHRKYQDSRSPGGRLRWTSCASYFPLSLESLLTSLQDSPTQTRAAIRRDAASADPASRPPERMGVRQPRQRWRGESRVGNSPRPVRSSSHLPRTGNRLLRRYQGADGYDSRFPAADQPRAR